MNGHALLEVRDLAKAFGGVRAVDGVTFALAAGEMLALIGPNGAGKSTTFNIVNGQLRPDRGSVCLEGRELVGLPAQAVWRLGVGRTFQIAETFASFTVAENVQMALLSRDRGLFGMWRRASTHAPAEAIALLGQVGMHEQAGRPCADLAYGDIKRVELAMALAHGPRLLLMDEPTAGMAAAERAELMALVRTLVAQRRMAVLFTEHNMDMVFTHADRIVVMARGQVLAQGSPSEIRSHAGVRAAYLGDDAAPVGRVEPVSGTP